MEPLYQGGLLSQVVYQIFLFFRRLEVMLQKRELVLRMPRPYFAERYRIQQYLEVDVNLVLVYSLHYVSKGLDRLREEQELSELSKANKIERAAPPYFYYPRLK